VLRQLLPDGLRADGRRRASGDCRRRRQAQHSRKPAPAGAVRLAPVAGVDHTGPRPQNARRPAVSPTLMTASPQSNAPRRAGVFAAVRALLLGVCFCRGSAAQETRDPVTGFAREPIHVAAWPGGKKVAVSFALFVEEFGFGQGPVYRPDMTTRNPDLV